jgi:chromosome segregation ATPase
MEATEKKLMDHEYQIRELKVIITDTNEQVKETSKSVSLLATNVGKLDVILEKMTNMNDTYSSANKRLFEKLDTTEKALSELKVDRTSALKDITNLDNRVTSLEGYITKGVLGVLAAVGMSLMGLVFKWQ